MAQAAKIPYVIQDNFVSVLVNGRPFQLVASHPTFRKMVNALKMKRWAKVPDLVNLAMSISNRSHGNVEVKGEEVFYKGSPVHSSLTALMLRLIEAGQPVNHMLKFMNHLFSNPRPEAVSGLYEFLTLYQMPITDDGCFVAYKRVDHNYKDIHTHTVDNHVGACPVMRRRDVDKDASNPCSRGFHFCSRAYLSGFQGEHLMAIKVNPADVDEIPEVQCGKGRTWRYEVIAEIPNGDYKEMDAAYFQNPLISIGHDRKLLLGKLLALPLVKRLVGKTERKLAEYKKARRKLGDIHPKVEHAGLTTAALKKASFGRLQQWYERFTAIAPELPGVSAVFANPTYPARVAAKLTVTQVAKQMGMKASVVYKLERAETPSQKFIDDYIGAVMALKERPNGISFAAATIAA